jgi:hypothetical protein
MCASLRDVTVLVTLTCMNRYHRTLYNVCFITTQLKISLHFRKHRKEDLYHLITYCKHVSGNSIKQMRQLIFTLLYFQQQKKSMCQKISQKKHIKFRFCYRVSYFTLCSHGTTRKEDIWLQLVDIKERQFLVMLHWLPCGMSPTVQHAQFFASQERFTREIVLARDGV